jgi:hypothetical protein
LFFAPQDSFAKKKKDDDKKEETKKDTVVSKIGALKWRNIGPAGQVDVSLILP